MLDNNLDKVHVAEGEFNVPMRGAIPFSELLENSKRMRIRFLADNVKVIEHTVERDVCGDGPFPRTARFVRCNYCRVQLRQKVQTPHIVGPDPDRRFSIAFLGDSFWPVFVIWPEDAESLEVGDVEVPVAMPANGACRDCGRRYGDEYGFPDLIIPDDAWEIIMPGSNGDGLLCPCCILRRLHYAGVKCAGEFVSGPLYRRKTK